MPKTTVKSSVEYTLVLNEEEAQYLKALLQNKLMKEESKEMESMRSSIWSSLHESGVKSV